MSKVKKILLSLFLSCISMHVLAEKNTQSLDQMIAVVNDDVITTSELNQATEIAKSQIASQNVAMPSDKILKKQVLEQLINKKVQLQLAKQAGIDITDTELNKAIHHIASQNNVSVDILYNEIKKTGMTKQEYRDEMHDQLLIQKLQQHEIASKITISPEEVTTFMNSQVWHNNNAKEYRIEDILIPIADTPSPEDLAKAKNRAMSVLSKLKNGEDFHTIAQSESSNKNALQGGDLGWRNLPEIPTAFTDEVSHMRKAEVAGPIQTPNGFHIIKLADIRSQNGSKQKLDRKAVENLLLQQKFEEAMQGWVSKLRSQAFINVEPIKA